jgi:hypothetical protein
MNDKYLDDVIKSLDDADLNDPSDLPPFGICLAEHAKRQREYDIACALWIMQYPRVVVTELHEKSFPLARMRRVFIAQVALIPPLVRKSFMALNESCDPSMRRFMDITKRLNFRNMAIIAGILFGRAPHVISSDDLRHGIQILLEMYA